MKRILILNYEFPPLGAAASPVSYEIAKVIIYGFGVYHVRSKKEICHPKEIVA